MSFSKSKVERFPSTTTASDGSALERKRHYGSTNTSVSEISSFQEIRKRYSPSPFKKGNSLNSGVMGSAKKKERPDQSKGRTYVLTPNGSRSGKVIVSKPQVHSPFSTKAGLSLGSIGRKSNKGKLDKSRASNLKEREALSQEQRNFNNNTLRAKRRKLDVNESSTSTGELFLTPLTSPLPLVINYEVSSSSNKSLAFEMSLALETPSHAVPVSKSILEEVTNLQEPLNPEGEPETDEENDIANITVTTPGRKPMRYSFHRATPPSSPTVLVLESLDADSSPPAYRIVSRRNSVQTMNESLFYPPSWDDRSRMESTVLSRNYDDSNMEPSPSSSGTSGLFSINRFKRAVISLFSSPKPVQEINGKPSKNASPILSSSWEPQNVMQYRTRIGWQNVIRALRREARHTAHDIKLGLVVPANNYIRSQRFWMPILEFVAGQTIAVIQSSFS